MTLNKIIAGIQILQPYYAKPDGYHMGAEHDAIFMFATDLPVSDEDCKRLAELGWFQEEAEEDEHENRVYDPEESWTAYV